MSPPVAGTGRRGVDCDKGWGAGGGSNEPRVRSSEEAASPSGKAVRANEAEHATTSRSATCKLEERAPPA